MEKAKENLVDGKYSIRDLIDLERLRGILENFSKSTRSTIGVFSYPEQEILITTGWRDVCAKFHRLNPQSEKFCISSNLSLTNKLKNPGDVNIEICENGLVEGGTPIIIKDQHIATLITSQVFFEKPDIERFKKQAEKFGYDIDAYLKAVKDTPIVKEADFRATIKFLGEIASLIAEIGYERLEVRESNAKLVEEISQRKKAESQINHLNAILRAISRINQLVINEKDEKTILENTCRIIAECHDYRMVWIGLVGENDREIIPAAHAGFDDNYLRSIRVMWDDSPLGCGPSGIAVKTCKPSVVGDISSDPCFGPWREEAVRRGYASTISLPIIWSENVFGVLNLYSERRNAFDDHEIALLSELSGNIGFALRTIKVEAERASSEEAFQVSEANYRAIFDTANDAIFIHDIETGQIVDVNQKTCEMYLYPKEEMLRMNVGDLSLGEAPYRQEDAMNFINKAASGEPQLFEWVAKDKAQRLFWVEVNLKRAVIGGKYRIVAIVRDITERKQREERWAKINETFLSFSADPYENINRLTALCGELLGADCALYNRLEEGRYQIRACGQWNTPPDFVPVDNPEGHICYDVVKKGGDEVVVIRNLQETNYAKTDPNVAKYNLQTYMGRAVKFGNEFIGTICVVYQYDINPTDEDKDIVSFIALAIGVEEERRNAEEVSQIAQFAIERSADAIFWVSPDAKILQVNDMACKSLGYSREELMSMSVPDIDPNYTYEKWPAHWNEIKEKGSFSFETTHRRKDGTTFPVEITVNYLEFQGSEYNFAHARDITSRKKQEESLLRRDYQLEILSRTSQHINAVLDTPIILRTLVAAAIELVDAMGGTAGIVFGDKMVFKEYNKDGKVEHIDYVFRAGEGICGCITKTHKTYICNDAEKDPNITPEIRKEFDLYNLVNVPILNREGKLLGCLELHNKKDRQPFDAQDVFMLQGLAASAAVALENASIMAQRDKAEKALAWQKEYYETLLDEANVWIDVMDQDGKILLWNKKAEEISGYKREELIGNVRKWNLLYPDSRQRARILNFMKRLVAAGKTIKDLETEIATASGEKKIVAWSSTIIRDSYGKIVGGMFVGTDVTARRVAEREREALNKELVKINKRLNQLALKDSQTGLYNYHYLTEIIEPEFYRAKRYVHPLSVIMIDIDYFKSVNDLYGHEFGDLVLKQFASQLRRMVRRYDVVVRFGGEEFVIISSGTDRQKAMLLGQRLLEALTLYNFGDKKHIVKLKLSVAVASYPDDAVTKGMDLISLADKILDAVKAAGGAKTYSSLDVKKRKVSQSEAGDITDVRFLKEQIAMLTKRGKQSLMEAIFAFAKTIEMRDHYTGEHADSTVKYSTQIARALSMSQEEIDNVRKAAILHDLGKIGISDKILLKRAKLTKKEFEEIKKHPQIAADIIRPIQFMQEIIPLILYHHERWDGKGYPTGLKGEGIPLGARIISIADVYQALTSDRPYRKAFSKKEAMKILKEGAGTQFDPAIVKIFLDILKREKNNHR
ncbi:MAG: PAS domain S-box protein [Candidatus Omnitrophica bacterium]|nr:PAS domain S-box protein [Candidatus Omnitrophota bacterium]